MHERDRRVGGFDGAFGGERAPHAGIRIEADDAHAAAREPARHVAAHAAEADDADVHGAMLPNPVHALRRDARTAAPTIIAAPTRVRSVGIS